MAQVQIPPPNPLAPIATFESLGGDVHARIFSNLDFTDLKTCRLVSKSWDCQISSQELLFGRGIIIHNSDETRSLLQNLTRVLQLFSRTLVFTVPSLRFNNRVGPTVFAWLRKANMESIRSVEFVNCSLYIHQFLLLLRQIPRICSLSMVNSKLMYYEERSNMGIKNPDFAKSCGIQEGIRNFGKLKKCDLKFASLADCNAFLELVFTKCTEIEDFRLSVLGCIHGCMRFNSVYKDLGMFMRKVRKSLKVLKLGLEGVPPPFSPEPEGGFGWFDKFLEILQLENWSNYQMDVLNELELGFPLTKSDLPRIQSVLSPFLHSLSSLKAFTLSRLAIETDQIEPVLEIVPVTSRKKVFIEQYIDDGFNFPTSHVKIRGTNWDLTMFFTTWTQALQQTIVLDQLPQLTHLIVSSGPQNPMFHVTDDFFQQILESGVNLKEMSVGGNVALEQFTDFGITGLSFEACQRMRDSQNYTIEPGDKIGQDLSNLTKLHTIRITGPTSNRITDISARFAFRGNPKLRCLEIWGTFSPDALTELRETFIHNQIVKIFTEAPAHTFLLPV